MNRKYELTQETIEVDGNTLYRIRALRDFGDVKSGDLGGFVDTEDTIIQAGDCWVSESARAYDNVFISGNARISGNACICRNIWIFGNVRVCGDAYIYYQTHRFLTKRIIAGNFEVNSGIWNRLVRVGNRIYLISTTMRKLLLE